MKKLSYLLPLALMINACTAPNSPHKTSPAELVLVERFKESLPSTADAVGQLLEDRFIKAHAPQYSHYLNTDNWKNEVGLFQTALVEKAQRQKLPHAELKRSLATILRNRGNLAIVPVEAYITKLSGREAWIIVCLWEDDVSKISQTSPPAQTGNPIKIAHSEHVTLGISHVRVFVYYTDDNMLGAFATCL